MIMKLAVLICFLFLNLFAQTPYFLEPSKEPTKENYPIKNHHAKLNMDCKLCHGSKVSENKFEIVTREKCLECHKSYEALEKLTANLGYEDNVHASPHYPKMDCKLCHSSHKPTQNYCIMCHSQDSMKKLIVP
ncbi:cytochrome c3 family protein [Campylobacter volucris]|nr:cytochrome c3 family protein [Campylobacter volucris]